MVREELVLISFFLSFQQYCKVCYILRSVQQCSLNTFLLKRNRKFPNFSGSVSVKRFLRIELNRQIKTAMIYILHLTLDSIYIFQSDNGEIV